MLDTPASRHDAVILFPEYWDDRRPPCLPSVYEGTEDANCRPDACSQTLHSLNCLPALWPTLEKSVVQAFYELS